MAVMGIWARRFMLLALAVVWAGLVPRAEAADEPARVQVNFPPHIQAVAFSPDAATLISVDDLGQVRIWNVETGKELRSFGTTRLSIEVLELSPDGKTLAAASGGAIDLWDLETGRAIRSFDANVGTIEAITFSPDSKILASCGNDKTIRLWEFRTGVEVGHLTGHEGFVKGVKFSPDGLLIVTIGNDKTIRLWDAISRKELRKFPAESSFTGTLAFSPDGRTVAWSADNNLVGILEITSGNKFSKLKGHSSSVEAISFSRESDEIITVSKGLEILIWKNGKNTVLHRNVAPFLKKVLLSPDGQTVASVSSSNVIEIWAVKSSERLTSFPNLAYAMSSVSLAPDGRMVAAGGEGRSVPLWDSKTGKLLRALRGGNSSAFSVSFSPDGQWVASFDVAGFIRLWNVSGGYQQNHFESCMSLGIVVFSPDSRVVVAGCEDRTVRAWDVFTGKEIWKQPNLGNVVTLVKMSPDGRTVAVASESINGIYLLSAKTGQKQRLLEGSSAYGIAFSADGRMLACFGRDGTVRLLDVDTGKLLKTFGGLEVTRIPMSGISISADGRILAAGSANEIVLWDIVSGDALRSLRTEGPPLVILDLAFSRDGRLLFAATLELKGDTLNFEMTGAVDIWSVDSGKRRASLHNLSSGGYLTTTPEGFFDGSPDAASLLSIARGNEVKPLGALEKQLNRPDLVQAALAGDPDGKVKSAAAALRLDAVFDVPAPQAAPPPAVATVAPPVKAPAFPDEHRVALVIGNAAYSGMSPLVNTPSDVAEMEKALAAAKFEVKTIIDADRRRMGEAIADFGRVAAGADVAVFYYSGHGIGLGEKNYLIPTDLKLTTEYMMRKDAYELDDILHAMDGARKLRLVLLDACRDNPFLAALANDGTKGARRTGLADPQVARNEGNVLVAFAAAPGQTAADGSKGNSPFARALLGRLFKPGERVESALADVTEDVLKETGYKQRPFVSGSVAGRIYLGGQ